MRKLTFISLAAALAVIALFVVSSLGRGSLAASPSAEQELRLLVPKILAAWGTLDITKVDPYYAADADFTYFDLAPMKYNNWAEYRAGVQKAFFEPNSSATLKANDDLRVHVRGSLAWATCTFGIDMVSKQGAASHLDGRWTMVFEKRAKGWTVVHEHVSVPLPSS